MVKQRLKIHEVAADGQCLFNSVGYLLLYHNKEDYSRPSVSKVATQLRKKVCDMMKKEVESEKEKNYSERILTQFLSYELNSISNNKNVNFNEPGIHLKRAEKYIRIMRKRGTWGGMLELKFLSKIVNGLDFKGIKVYRLKREKLKKNTVTGLTHVGKLYEIRGGFVQETNNTRKKQVLEIILHNFEQGGNHYDPLIPVRRKSDK